MKILGFVAGLAIGAAIYYHVSRHRAVFITPEKTRKLKPMPLKAFNLN